jgi:hypothetical protein
MPVHPSDAHDSRHVTESGSIGRPASETPSTTWLDQMGPMKCIYRVDEHGMCGWNVSAKCRKQSL